MSVIIPTYNRQTTLRATLKSLETQTWPADRYEVIVVDDGSTDGTAGIAREGFPFPVRYVRQENQGSASARNNGAQKSRGEILIFVDDDMILEPGYIEGLTEQHIAHQRTVVMGTCFLDPLDCDAPFARFSAETASQRVSEHKNHTATFTDCVTNNLSIERNGFFEVGGMQDIAGDGPTWWGDVEFGYRAWRAGFGFRRSRKAICHHRDYSVCNFPEACSRARRAAQYAVLLFSQHPDLRPHIPMFRDKGPVSWKTDRPPLIARKLARRTTAYRPAVWILRQLVRVVEKLAPEHGALRALYRWTIGACIARGYREGLREYPSPREIL